MVEPIFQAPPPPPMNQNDSFQTEHHEEQLQEKILQNESPSVQQTSEKDTQNTAQKEQVLKRLNELKENFVRYFWYSIAGLFLLGMFFGCAMSGGDNQPQKQYQGRVLTRIIENSNIRTRLPICGTDLISEPCVFYVMNYSSTDHLPMDYYTYVSNAMQRPPDSIKIENLSYKELIPPGYFAEIIVPAKR